jgi:hypothetical protein
MQAGARIGISAAALLLVLFVLSTNSRTVAIGNDCLPKGMVANAREAMADAASLALATGEIVAMAHGHTLLLVTRGSQEIPPGCPYNPQ